MVGNPPRLAAHKHCLGGVPAAQQANGNAAQAAQAGAVHHGAPPGAVEALKDVEEQRVADLFREHHDRDPAEVDPAETHDPARLARYPMQFATRAAAFAHSALLLAVALAAFAGRDPKHAIYLWAFLSYNPLSMLASYRANRAGGEPAGGEDGDEEDAEHAGQGHGGGVPPPDPGRSFASRAWKALRELGQGQLAAHSARSTVPNPLTSRARRAWPSSPVSFGL